MSETPNAGLPLLAAAQAQKHVTVNEALARLDGLSRASVKSAVLTDPPATSAEGDRFLVASPSGGDWAGHDGDLAYFFGGGWNFVAPAPGWRVWLEDEAAPAIWSGAGWIRGAIGGASGFGCVTASTVGGDEPVPAGAGFATSLTIPDRSVVIGVSGRVISEITGGGLTGWRIGVAGATDRYGGGVGLAQNSYLNGITGAPVGYYGDTPLQVEPEGGDFSGGMIRLAIHFLQLTPPDPV